MRQLRAFFLRLFASLRSDDSETAFKDELEAHVQLHTEDNLRQGMRPDEARRAALMKLGGVERTRQAYRERRTLPFLETFVQDLRFASRQLLKNPGFTAIATLVLALGIGSSIAIFAFVDATLIKPLPYREPSRLLHLFESNRTGPRYHLSYLDYRDWRVMSHSFESMAIYEVGDFLLFDSGSTTKVTGIRISDGFLRTLGVQPVLGRDFQPEEEQSAPSSTVLLSYSLWQTRFQAKQSVLGQKIILNNTAATVVGVLPKDFHFAPGGSADYWLTVDPQSECGKNRSCHDFYGVGRLRNGISIAAAANELSSIARELERRYPATNVHRGASTLPLVDTILGEVRPLLLVLLAGSLLLLFLACLNVSCLLLVRTESRKREIAVRGALGATPLRLIRQFLTEGLLLTLFGNLLGFLLAATTIHLLLRAIPEDRLASMPYFRGVNLSVHVLLYGVAISLFTGILFSVAPLMRISLKSVQEGLTEGARGAAGTLWRRFGAKLVVMELATAMVLMVGASLLGKSFYRLLQVDTGLKAEHLAALRIWLPTSAYPKDEQIVSLESRIHDRVARLPGVKSTGLAQQLPVGDGDGILSIGFRSKPELADQNEVNYRSISTTYFQTIQAQLLHGRLFSDADTAQRPPVVIVNATFARQYFGKENPLGQKLFYSRNPDKTSLEIVGVIDDIKEGPLDIATRPVLYVPLEQDAENQVYVVARTTQSPEATLAAMSTAIHELDPAVACYDAITMADHIQGSPSAALHRGSAWLIGCFAALAFLLGVVGLYGVISYTVKQRTREIGVRMALGAQRHSVTAMVFKEAGFLTLAGMGLGLVCSLGAATFLRSLLFQVSAWDLSTIAVVSLLLSISTLLAATLPARRAASVNPVEALRTE